MDPMSFISVAPPEWIPLLICLGILYKAYELWMKRKDYDDPDDGTQTEPVG